MKKIIVPTDFSPPAKNAARYAVHLATLLQEDVLLCNAVFIPLEALVAGQVSWPLEDYESLKANAAEQLSACAHQLQERLNEQAAFFPEDFKPAISFTSEAGPVTAVVRNVLSEHHGSMVVMGMSGAGGLERFFIGSSSKDLIDKANFPVLLIPKVMVFRGLKKIAFATDLHKGDINVIHSLARLARVLDAELQIRHITDQKFEQGDEKLKADMFMAALSKKVNYEKMHYRHIKSMDVDHGLDWLQEHSLVDMIVMVHRPHNFLSKLILGSHTQQLAGHVTIPLLVYPPEYGTPL